MLVLDRVKHTFGSKVAVSDVSLEIGGGVTALIGVNGAGKSTLLSIAAGAIQPREGMALLDGHDLYGRSSRSKALGRVALMPQSATFPGSMTAREVTEYLAWMRGARWRDARVAAADALARVLLEDRAESKVKSLSGGMLRRLCLAQALAAKADVLLLDEPSTGLDPEQRRVMVNLLSEVSGAVVLSSHVMEDITDLATRVVVLDAGAVAFDGALTDLVSRAPDASEARAAEAGFLAVLVEARAGKP